MTREQKPNKPPRPMRLPASPFVSPARAVGDLAAKPIANMLGRRGFAGADLFTHWRAIVGEELADRCAPERISWPRETSDDPEAPAARGATLYVRVSGPQAIEVQHGSGEIIERVNQMYGFAAIARLRIVQAPLHAGEAPAQKPRPPGGEPGPSPDLESALSRLGAAVRGHTKG